jgi:hypothetical protein
MRGLVRRISVFFAFFAAVSVFFSVEFEFVSWPAEGDA